MMILEFLISILGYPVKWFWSHYETYKEVHDIKRLILLFSVSLSGLIVLSLGFFKLANYLFAYHLNLIIFISIIIWLYAYIRDKYMSNLPEPPENDNIALWEQAEKGYPIMRNIVFQTTKSIAPDIGGKIPRLLGEIEMPEDRFLIANDICYYQFRLSKEDMRVQYTANDVQEFQHIFQSALSHKIQSGAFPTLKLENYRDAYGNWHDCVELDTMEDVGSFFIIQTVFCSPEYAEYRHHLAMEKTAQADTNTTIDTTWDNNR